MASKNVSVYLLSLVFIKHESDFVNSLSAFEIGASIKACSRVKRTIRDFTIVYVHSKIILMLGLAPQTMGEQKFHMV